MLLTSLFADKSILTEVFMGKTKGRTILLKDHQEIKEGHDG